MYRGLRADHPIDIWDYPRGRWVPYADAGPRERGWGRQINFAQARRLKKNNPGAEHFVYYDIPPWLHRSSQGYLGTVLPDHVNLRLAKLRKII